MTYSFIVIDILMIANDDGMTCCRHQIYYCYYYRLFNYWMIILFDIDALFICMAGGQEGSGILVMISISNMFILFVRLFTLVIIRVISGGVFIVFLFAVMLVAWMMMVDCSFSIFIV